MRADSTFEARVLARLAELDAQGLRRSLRPPSGIDLCSNDYLNLSSHPLLISRFIDGAKREGCGSTGSRLLRGERASFATIEQRFADFKRTERALYFSTGYMANVAVLTTLPEAGDVIFSDARNHASLIDGARLSRAKTVVFPHNDAEALGVLMNRTNTDGVSFIVIESLFSMDGDFAALDEYAAIARSTGAVLVVDEAHAVGICGARGSGALEEAGLADEVVCVSINTAGKALGVSGAFVAGPEWAIDYLIQRGRPFVFSTAPPPAVTDALDASLTLIEQEPERRDRLKSRATYLRDRLRKAGVEVAAGASHIVPIVIGDNERTMAVAEILQKEGFDVRAIRPPSVPQGSARLRVSVNAGLTEAILDRFVDILSVALREAGLCSAASL